MSKKDNTIKWKKELKKRGWPSNFKFNFDVNRWGSCQYSSALATYDLYFKMRETLSMKDTLDLLGVKFAFDRKNTFTNIRQSFVDEIEKNYADYDWYTEEEVKERVEAAKRAKNFDDMFETVANNSWDLWSAAPFVAGYAFENYTLEGAPESPGTGPILNVAVQSVNLKIGLLCALLKDYKQVKEEKSFVGFDT
jgi:hypothetical protein